MIKECYLSNAALHNGGLCGLIVLLSKFNEFAVKQSDKKNCYFNQHLARNEKIPKWKANLKSNGQRN